MRIINVIHIQGGVLNSVTSFPISSDIGKSKQEEIIKKAENYFIDTIYSLMGKRYSVKEEEEFIENGVWEENYKEVLLTWSDVKL